MGITVMVRKATGSGIGIVGVVLLLSGVIVCFLWTLDVLFTAFGLWALLVGLLAAPVTYVVSIFVVWLTTGAFPALMLVPFIAGWVGLALITLGQKVRGD